MADYTPPEVPTLDQAGQQAVTNPDYLAQTNLYDHQTAQDTATLNTQKTGIQNSYAQSRQSAINSYQDALDQINYGMKQYIIYIKTDRLWTPNSFINMIGT